MAKKNNPLVDAPVDKLDLFLRTNYKTILFCFAAVIVVAIVTYGVLSLTEQNRLAKAGAIGTAELMGLSNPVAIETYSGMADTLTFAKDYIHLQAAVSYAKIGEKEKALTELTTVSGVYAEFAGNLRCDLSSSENSSGCPLSSAGIFAPISYYRAVLSADEDGRAALMNEFRTNWPESALLSQLERWGY
jgi:hypothetical protein